MTRKNRPNQRAQLPKTNQLFRSFGFRHELTAHNPNFYNFMDSLSQKFEVEPVEENTPKAKVLDPSKLSLKIVERYGVSIALRRARLRLNRSEVGAIKQDVRSSIGKAGLNVSNLSIVFDRIVPVGSERTEGEKGKFALAPRIDQEPFELIMEEFAICTSALKQKGIPDIRYPDAEWVPHMSVVISREESRTVGTQVEEVLANHGAVRMQFDGLQYYDEKTESMV